MDVNEESGVFKEVACEGWRLCGVREQTARAEWCNTEDERVINIFPECFTLDYEIKIP